MKKLTTTQLQEIIKEATAKGPGLKFPITVTVDYTFEWETRPYEEPLLSASAVSNPNDTHPVLSAPANPPRDRNRPHPTLFKAAKEYALANPVKNERKLPPESAPVPITYVVSEIHRDEYNYIKVISRGKTIATLPPSYKTIGVAQELADLAKQWIKENPRKTEKQILSSQPRTDAEATVKSNGHGGKIYDLGAGVTKEVTKDGWTMWRLRGKFHRDGDKPAVIEPDGSKSWYINGKLHRLGDLPAKINSKGGKAWYKNGKMHRDGGKPAHIFDGVQEWYVNGRFIKQQHEDGKIVRR